MKNLVTMLALSFALQVQAEDIKTTLATYQKAYDQDLAKMEAESKKAIADWPDQYLQALKTLEQKFQTAGDLESLIAVRKEKDRFAETKQMPAEAIVQIPKELADLQGKAVKVLQNIELKRNKQIVTAANKYTAGLEELRTSLTKQGKVDDAVVVNTEMEGIKQRAEVTAAQFVLADAGVDMTATNTTPKEVAVTSKGIPQSLKKNLVLYYSFDREEKGFGRNDKVTVTDKSGKGNGGEVDGAKWTAKGKIGGAYSFDGKSCITADGSKLPARNSSRTVALWLYKEHGSGNIAFAYGAHRPNESFGIALVSLKPNNAYVYVEIGWNDLQGITDQGLNRWVHVCVVYDESKGKMTIYGNGVMENSKSMSPNTSNNSTVYVGRPNFEETYWKGSVDEVMIFNRALPAEEVRQLYNLQK